ncbi:GL22192 [Drosophila persimilis]|uniref:GL22192 n=1 Tax=Drosophila persimilis TaxID=7234 RepID=B4GFE3_DROPE|nr:GL22192 [Drosophila persimilis]
MWFVVVLFAVAAVCGLAGRKWGRYLYLHYGRHLLPRSLLANKNRAPTPPLSPTKDDQSLEALLDESGEMHETVGVELAIKSSLALPSKIVLVMFAWSHWKAPSDTDTATKAISESCRN